MRFQVRLASSARSLLFGLFVFLGTTALAGCSEKSAGTSSATAGASTNATSPLASTTATLPASSASSTASSALAAPTSTAPAEPSPVHLAFVGDIAFNYSIAKNLEALSDGTAPKDIEPGFPFAGVKERLSAADIAVANLECVISSKGTLDTWHKPFRGPLAGVDALLAAGIDIVTVANNHSWDFGHDGFFDMLQNLDAKKLPVLGRGYRQKTKHDPEKAYIREVRGTRIAFLGFYLATDEDLTRDIAAAAKEADMVVAYFHWGREKQSEATPEQKVQAHAAIDAGATLVVGSHVHVLQPTEVYKGHLIAYGLGNFVFMGMNHEERFRRAAILEVALTPTHLVAFELVPTRLDDHGAPRLVVPESSYLPPKTNPSATPEKSD